MYNKWKITIKILLICASEIGGINMHRMTFRNANLLYNRLFVSMCAWLLFDELYMKGACHF